MRFKIRKCRKCSRYTLKEKCPVCDESTISAHPAKFSPDDKYAILKAIATKKLD